MSVLEKINNLSWHNLISKLKDILKDLSSSSTGEVQYKVYTALMTQVGTNAPTAVVLANTLGGEIIWTRSNTGYYKGTLNGAFIQDKTYTSITIDNNNGNVFKDIYVDNINEIAIQTWTDLAATSTSDEQLLNTPIEIRVYN